MNFYYCGRLASEFGIQYAPKDIQSTRKSLSLRCWRRMSPASMAGIRRLSETLSEKTEGNGCR